MKTLLDLINGNLIAKNLLNTVTTKKGNISSHYLKIEANKAYKAAVNEENFSFSSLQNFCRNVNEKSIENLTNANGLKITDDNFSEDTKYLQRLTIWLKLKSMNLQNDEILFSHITTFGTEKELNSKDGKKTVISLNLFLTCLERYNATKVKSNLEAEEAAAKERGEAAEAEEKAKKEAEAAEAAAKANKSRVNAKKAEAAAKAA